MKIKNAYCTAVLLLNLVCLYFILDLASYDVIIGYLRDGSEKFSTPRRLVYIFLFNCIMNLFLIIAMLMRNLMFTTALHKAQR